MSQCGQIGTNETQKMIPCLPHPLLWTWKKLRTMLISLWLVLAAGEWKLSNVLLARAGVVCGFIRWRQMRTWLTFRLRRIVSAWANIIPKALEQVATQREAC